MNLPPLYLTSHIRAIEHRYGADDLMERAGLAAAELAGSLTENGGRILIIAGPGNNGGDALVAARHLKQQWFNVTLVLIGDPAKLPQDAAAAHEQWIAAGGNTFTDIPDVPCDLVIDGLFGIGLQRPLEGCHAELVQRINAMGTPILSLDIPSGLCADTGRVLGVAISADHTLTFIGLKPGLFTLEGPDHAGMVHITDLGISTTTETRNPSGGLLIDQPPVRPGARKHNTHKGSYGSTGILGGANGMVGAALLAARAALLLGAGRVYCALLADHPPAVDFSYPELMLCSSTTLLGIESISCLAIGPGMGRAPAALQTLQTALRSRTPLVLDADALQLLATDQHLQASLCKRGNAILTPHPGEAAALLHTETSHVQQDRIHAALHISEQFNSITVLKGAGSIVAFPDGRWFVNASGNPGLSSAGQGDVLTGMIAALIAQGLPLAEACLLGVHLHGAAADVLVEHGTGPAGLTASETILASRSLMNHW